MEARGAWGYDLSRDGMHKEYKSVGLAIDFTTIPWSFLFGNHKHLAKVSRLLVRRFFSLEL
jgi:hypothetical protein